MFRHALFLLPQLGVVSPVKSATRTCGNPDFCGSDDLDRSSDAGSMPVGSGCNQIIQKQIRLFGNSLECCFCAEWKITVQNRTARKPGFFTDSSWINHAGLENGYGEHRDWRTDCRVDRAALCLDPSLFAPLPRRRCGRSHPKGKRFTDLGALGPSDACAMAKLGTISVAQRMRQFDADKFVPTPHRSVALPPGFPLPAKIGVEFDDSVEWAGAVMTNTQ